MKPEVSLASCCSSQLSSTQLSSARLDSAQIRQVAPLLPISHNNNNNNIQSDVHISSKTTKLYGKLHYQAIISETLSMNKTLTFLTELQVAMPKRNNSLEIEIENENENKDEHKQINIRQFNGIKLQQLIKITFASLLASQLDIHK